MSFVKTLTLNIFFFKATPALPYIYIYVGFQKQFERCVLQRHPFVTIHTRHKKVPVHPLMPETAHLCLYLHLITRTRIKKKTFHPSQHSKTDAQNIGKYANLTSGLCVCSPQKANILTVSL